MKTITQQLTRRFIPSPCRNTPLRNSNRTLHSFEAPSLSRPTTTPASLFDNSLSPGFATWTRSVFQHHSQIRGAAFLRPGPGRDNPDLLLKTQAPSRTASTKEQTIETATSTRKDDEEEEDDYDDYEDDDEDIDDEFEEGDTVITMSAPSSSPKQDLVSKDKRPRPTSYKEIVLLETDFRERFIKGGGNGGQKINKTNSNVELKHFETGIVVQCQATRSLPQNRKLARRILIGRLDEYYNGELSKRGQKADKIRTKKKRMARKSAKKYHSETGAAADDDERDEVSEIRSGGSSSDNKDIIPEIHSLTLEEILASDNKKPSRRKSSRKDA
ncbi:hypothetical protein BGZ83_005248 [Gryganskiella cystojenkinii]|nr:hypothetical protein BGZ83_005248 [Gryganskiella cystojenkinii]